MAFWTVAQTESSRENVAARFLRQIGYESYLPKILLRKRVVPLFPSYLFVVIEAQWHAARWSPGVLRLLMADEERPAHVPDRVVEAIQRREGENGLIKLPKPKVRGLQRGDSVRVIRGSFEGQFAVYDGMAGPDRSRLLLEMLGRKVPVQLPIADMVAL